jgi:GntR family transcriptional regulator
MRHTGVKSAGGLSYTPDMRDSEALDRSSFVPLYYQLQELIKEQIESGGWKPGDRLASEAELARRYAISRVVVRQALAILQDDGQIVRVQGRGTFVAEPKLDARAGGLARLLATPRAPDVAIEVLEAGTPPVEPSIRSGLGVDESERVLRLTTGLSVRGIPLAITYSFFRAADVPWLEEAVRVGRPLPRELVLADYGIELGGSSLSIETSQCGQFEADRFGIPHRSAVFLVLSTELRRAASGTVPFEVARVEYRGDLLQLRLEVSGDAPGAIEAVWALTDEADGRLAERARVSAA